MEIQAKFNSTEIDIISEIISISFAKAADSFAMMANKKILIKHFDLTITEPEMFAIDSDYANDENLAIVLSDIVGDFKGQSALLFNRKDRETLATACLGTAFSRDRGFREMEGEFLKEMGNVLTGSLITQFCNILKVNMYGTVPKLEYGSITDLKKTIKRDYRGESPLILAIYNEFEIEEMTMTPKMLLIYNEEALNKMQDVISSFDMSDTFLF